MRKTTFKIGQNHAEYVENWKTILSCLQKYRGKWKLLMKPVKT